MGGGDDEAKSPAAEEDLYVECSDDENYGPEKGKWQPAPADIIELLGTLAKGEVPDLDWKCPGRRDPDSDTNRENMDTTETPKRQEFELEKPDKRAVTTEFDFDEPSQDLKITPRRTPGVGRTPKPPKRVARLDQIMSDIMRHRKIDAEAAKEERIEKGTARGMSPKVFPGSPRGMPAGSPRLTQPSGSVSPKGLSGSPRAPSAGNSPKAGLYGIPGSPKGHQYSFAGSPKGSLGGSPKGVPSSCSPKGIPPSGSPKGVSSSGSPKGIPSSFSPSHSTSGGSPKGISYGGSPKGSSPKVSAESPKGHIPSDTDRMKEYDMPP